MHLPSPLVLLSSATTLLMGFGLAWWWRSRLHATDLDRLERDMTDQVTDHLDSLRHLESSVRGAVERFAACERELGEQVDRRNLALRELGDAVDRLLGEPSAEAGAPLAFRDRITPVAGPPPALDAPGAQLAEWERRFDCVLGALRAEHQHQAEVLAEITDRLGHVPALSSGVGDAEAGLHESEVELLELRTRCSELELELAEARLAVEEARSAAAHAGEPAGDTDMRTNDEPDEDLTPEAEPEARPELSEELSVLDDPFAAPEARDASWLLEHEEPAAAELGETPAPEPEQDHEVPAQPPAPVAAKPEPARPAPQPVAVPASSAVAAAASPIEPTTTPSPKSTARPAAGSPTHRTAMTETLDRARQEAEHLTSDLKSMLQRIEALQGAVSDADRAGAQLASTLHECEEALKAEKSGHQRTEARLVASKEEVKNLFFQLDETQKGLQSVISASDAREKEMRAQITGLEARLAVAEPAVAEAQALRTDKAELQSTLEARERLIAALEDKLTQCEAKLLEERAQTDRLRGEVGDLTRQADATRKAMAEKERQFESATQLLNKLRPMVEALEGELTHRPTNAA